jgi:quercetin dioxygenase-like cupin family protein
MKIPAGIDVAPHAHPNNCILFMVSGNIRLTLENSDVILGQGDMALIPANLKVGLVNESNSEAETLAIVLSPNYGSLDEFKQRLTNLLKGEKD